jgi:hypothetical protein
MKLCVVGLLTLAVSGCVPGVPIPIPLPGGPNPPKPASEVVQDAVTPRDGAGAILVMRDKQLRERGCTYDIVLDGQTVAGLRSGEQVALYADPGNRIVGIRKGREKDCDAAVAELPLKVVANATTRVRVRSDSHYDLKVEATSY